MKFLQKIKDLFHSYKNVLLLGTVAAVLFAALSFQYISYHLLNSAENAAQAEKTEQRVVIDLQDAKWFDPIIHEDGAIVETDEVKFSADADDEAKPDEDVIEEKEVAPKDKPAEITEDKDDDAFTRGEKDDADKKPEVKALDKELIDPDKSKAEISIIIMNLGLSEPAIKAIGRLSKEFTLSFTPYGQISTKSSIYLAEEGYTILAELPMESTKTREDGGKFNISVTNEDFKNSQNFAAVRSVIPSAIGFLTPVDEDFSDQPRFDNIMKLILDEKSTLIYQGSSAKRVGDYSAINGLDALFPDLTIDRQPSAEDIKAQLRALETLALDKGYAIGLAHPYPITLEELEKWQTTLAEKKIKLVSVVEK